MVDAATLLHILVALGLAQLLMPAGRGQVWGSEGLLAFGLGMASFIASAGSGLSLTVASAVSISASPSFLVGSTALLILGPVGGLAGAVRACRPEMAPRAVLAGALNAGVLLVLMPFAFRVGIAPVAVTTGLLAVAVAMVFLLGRASRVGTVVRYVDRHVFARWHWSDELAAPSRGDLWWVGSSLVGVIMVVSRSPVMVIVAGALATAAGTYVLALRLADGPRFPVLPLLTAALIPYAVVLHGLGASSWSSMDYQFMALTTDIEIRVLPLVAVAAFGLAALWPVHGLIPRGVLAPVGGVVLVRLGADLLPAGLFLWQPVLSPLALVSVWWGGLTGRGTLLLTGWGFQALVTGLPAARVGALGLLWVALALGLLGMVPDRHRFWVTRVLYVFAGVGIISTLPAMLETQLVYSLLAVGGLGLALWRRVEA